MAGAIGKCAFCADFGGIFASFRLVRPELAGRCVLETDLAAHWVGLPASMAQEGAAVQNHGSKSGWHDATQRGGAGKLSAPQGWMTRMKHRGEAPCLEQGG